MYNGVDYYEGNDDYYYQYDFDNYDIHDDNENYEYQYEYINDGAYQDNEIITDIELNNAIMQINEFDLSDSKKGVKITLADQTYGVV